MLLGIPQAVATLLTIVLLYAMDFSLIRCNNKQNRQAAQGTQWISHGLQKRKRPGLHRHYVTRENKRIGLPTCWYTSGKADDLL